MAGVVVGALVCGCPVLRDEMHPAFGALALMLLSHLGMHRARVGRGRRVRF